MWVLIDRETNEEITRVSREALDSAVEMWSCFGVDVGVVHADDYKEVCPRGDPS